MRRHPLLFFAASALVLAACSLGGQDDARHLRLLQWQAPSTANPYISSGTKDVLASSLVLEPLAAIAPDGSYVPKLAEDIPTVANGGVAFDERFLVEFEPGLRPHQVRLQGGDASPDSFCYA